MEVSRKGPLLITAEGKNAIVVTGATFTKGDPNVPGNDVKIIDYYQLYEKKSGTLYFKKAFTVEEEKDEGIEDLLVEIFADEVIIDNKLELTIASLW